VYSRQALDLLTQIHDDLLSYKKKRSRLILDQYLELTPRNGKYTEQQKAARTRFEELVLGTKPNSIGESTAVYFPARALRKDCVYADTIL
jgi:hypothetical protein